MRDCVAFWELLGFTEIEPPPVLRDRFIWVERNGTHIHLIPREDPAIPVEGHAAVVAPDDRRSRACATTASTRARAATPGTPRAGS